MSDKQALNGGKLFSLREWLNLDEAARYLSLMFGEDVSAADILRLALDKHLVLSVNFVNQAYGKLGKLISPEEYQNDPQNVLANLPDELGGVKIKEEMMKFLFDRTPFPGFFLNLEKKISRIEGVWDLSMEFGQDYWIENLYQKNTGGPEVTSPFLGAQYVTREGGLVCEVQDLLEERLEYETDEGKKVIEFEGEIDRCYPACADSGLPYISILVVRPQALVDLQNRLSHGKLNNDAYLDCRAETTYLNIIGAMLETFVHKDHGDVDFTSETKLREFFSDKYAGFKGLTLRTLAEKFAVAKKAIREELD